MVGRQGLKVTKKPHFPFNVIFLLPENEISNSVKVFLAFILLYYYFFLTKKSNGSAGSAGFAGSGGSTVC